MITQGGRPLRRIWPADEGAFRAARSHIGEGKDDAQDPEKDHEQGGETLQEVGDYGAHADPPSSAEGEQEGGRERRWGGIVEWPEANTHRAQRVKTTRTTGAVNVPALAPLSYEGLSPVNRIPSPPTARGALPIRRSLQADDRPCYNMISGMAAWPLSACEA